jgi:hypothetical protein
MTTWICWCVINKDERISCQKKTITYFKEKFKNILKNKIFQVYITCFIHVINSLILFLYKCVDLLLKLRKTSR